MLNSSFRSVKRTCGVHYLVCSLSRVSRGYTTSPLPMSSTGKKNIIFIHPDLGIGGAERLVVDAAVGLKGRGHNVIIFTNHCDPTHCFDEARDGTNPLPIISLYY